MASSRDSATATPSTRPHESLRTASRPRFAQGELLLRYPRILETRVIINRPSDVAVADPECKANSAANCVQARGNPLMGVFRNGVNLGMEGYLVRRSLLGDTEVEQEAATDRRVTENHYPSDDNPYDSLYPVDDRADSVSVPQHWAKLNFGKMASSWSHFTATPSTRPYENLRDS